MFRKIIDYLNLRHIGGIELYFASLMILGSYSFKGIPLQVILWPTLFVMLFFKQKNRKTSLFKPLLFLAAYVLIHDFVYLFVANGNLNAYIMQMFYFVCIFMAINVFNIEKLKSSLNLVAIISMIGLLYQWGIIAMGGEVRPIQIPFLEMGQHRLEIFSIRPSSFFMEPAAYIAFMYIPFAFSLIDKKYIWTIVIILSEFLTTSTTGLLTSFIFLIVYFFTQRLSVKIRFLTLFIGGAMFFALTNISTFQNSINKLKDTDVETNIRLTQGPYVVSTMEAHDKLLGAPYHSAFDYCLTGRAPNVVFYDKEVYMSTIWLIIFKYGFVGLFLYLLFYYKITRKNSDTLPLVITLIVVMFSSSYGIGTIFTYTTIPLLLQILERRN